MDNDKCIDGHSDKINYSAEDQYNFTIQLLLNQLDVAESKRKGVEAEIDEYNELLQELMLLKDRYDVDNVQSYSGASTPSRASSETKRGRPLEVLVDLGHEISYCKAKIDNPHIIYVHVGLGGFHVEFTLTEAIKFISRRLDFLKSDVLPKRIQIARQFSIDVDHEISLMISE